MENYDFNHQAPLPSQYLRMPAGEPGSAVIPGVGGSSLARLVAANMTRPRDEYMKQMSKQWNPVWESMIDKAPREMRNTLKKIMSSGLGSQASLKFMQDPSIQDALGGNGIADYMATDRMYSHAGSFGGNLGTLGAGGRIQQFMPPTNPGDLIAQNEMRLRGTAQYQSMLYNRLYKDDTTGKTLPGGNMRFTGGMSAADAINLGSYASKYGGPMSQMAVAGPGSSRGEIEQVRQQTAGKVETHGHMARTMSEFMKIMGSADLQEALAQFKALEGREFGTVNPGTIQRKLRSMTTLAASANMSARDLLQMHSYGEGMMGAATGTGAGSGYDYGRKMHQGVVTNALENAAAVISAQGITDRGEQDRINNLWQRKAARQMNTTGGRSIGLIEQLHEAGRMDDEMYSRAMKTVGKGGNLGTMFNEIHAGTGVNIRRTMMNDNAWRETTWALNEDIRKDTLDRGGSQADADARLGASEKRAAVVSDARYTQDANRIYARAKAMSNKSQVRAMSREFGVSFSDEQKAGASQAAMADLSEAVKSYSNIDPAMKQEYMSRIAVAQQSGQSLSSLQREFRAEGSTGKMFADIGSSKYSRRLFDIIINTEAFAKGTNRGAIRSGDRMLTKLGLAAAEGDTPAAKDADIRAKLQGVIASETATPEQKNLAQGHLDKLEKQKTDVDKRAAKALKNLEKDVDQGHKVEQTGEPGAETKARTGGAPQLDIENRKKDMGRGADETESSKADGEAKAKDDRNNPVKGGKQEIKVTGNVTLMGGNTLLLDLEAPENERVTT